jgi:hypothetical protein
MRRYFAHVVAKSRATRGSNGSARHAVAKGLTTSKKSLAEIFQPRTVARPTNPPKKDNKFKALQWAKSLSSHRILAPERVLAVELFDRSWKPGISSGRVAVEVGRLRARALVTP